MHFIISSTTFGINKLQYSSSNCLDPWEVLRDFGEKSVVSQFTRSRDRFAG